jgi:hypothetical protein
MPGVVRRAKTGQGLAEIEHFLPPFGRRHVTLFSADSRFCFIYMVAVLVIHGLTPGLRQIEISKLSGGGDTSHR